MPSTTAAQLTRDNERLPLTRKRVGELARKARRHGYQLVSGYGGHGSVISVQCPLAGDEWSDRHRITADLSMYSSTGLSVPKTLDAAVAEHLDPGNRYLSDGTVDGEHMCPGMRPVVRTA